MMSVEIIVTGKIKEKYIREYAGEYEKRLGGLCKLTVVELDPVRLCDNPSQKEIENALQKEAAAIKAKIAKGAYVVSLCVEGRRLSSEELAETLQKNAMNGSGRFAFIIGSSYGLSKEIKDMSDFKLSMSEMTFPHKLARIMLTEQLYRAFSILGNSKYHK